MRLSIFAFFFLLLCSSLKGQDIDTAWYSETVTNGIRIQNSFPKGGPYPGPTKKHFNYSYLVFYSRVVNETEKPITFTVNFSADSIPIPNSPNTFVKLFLPSDTMTPEKQSQFSYGLTTVASLDASTKFQKKLNPKEDSLFYVVAIFYQTKADAWNEERGGNRGELILKGQDLFYRMLPQIDALPCGHITFHK
ncbi:hypothetical protein [Spongiimicrobium salis]|uniref:hypothetical protein n=1 Tax=Spongiimicrobium salis TaxID=1667022 RepID=UPI00374C9C01